MSPKISVVIPAYNEEKLLPSCIKAVQNQTLPKQEYEIIVVDNNSTDNTHKIATELGTNVVFYAQKQGFVFAKNEGARHATSPIIAFTDADSQPEANWLSDILTLMQEDESIMCVGGTILPSGKNTWLTFLFRVYDWIVRLHNIFGAPLPWSPNMAVRKSAFDAIHGFNPDVATGDDWDFVVRMQKAFGRRSVVYTSRLLVKTSPRKQKKFSMLLQYIGIGLINYLNMIILRRSKAMGAPVTVR